MRLRDVFRGWPGSSKEAQAQLAEAEAGLEHAREFRREIQEIVDPLRPALKRNHFEQAVQQMFMRRPANGRS